MRLGPHAVCHHPEQLSPGGDYVWPGLEVGFLGFFLSMKREGAGFLTMVAPDGGVGRGEGRGDDELPVLSSSASWSAREAPFGVSSGFLGVMNVAREGVRELLAVRGREGMEGGGQAKSSTPSGLMAREQQQAQGESWQRTQIVHCQCIRTTPGRAYSPRRSLHRTSE